MSEEEDPEIIVSKLSCTFLEGDVQVDVNIFRIADSDWTLELVDEDNASIVWNEQFETLEPSPAAGPSP